MRMATRVAIGDGVADQSGNSIVIDGKSLFWMGSFAAQALEEKKILRPVGRRAFGQLTSPYSLGLTVARNVSLSTLNLAHRHILLLTEAEERAIELGKEPEDVPFPWGDVPKAIKAGMYNSVLDVTVLSTRGVLDALAQGKLPRWLSHKMCKDLRKSAQRKVARYSVWTRWMKVAKTSLFSEATLFMAECSVSSLLDCGRILKRYNGAMSRKAVMHMGLRVGLQTARCTCLWLVVSLGNGVGSSSPKLQPLFMLACSNLASFLVNMYFGALSARIESALLVSSEKVKNKDDDDDRDDDSSDPPAQATPSGAAVAAVSDDYGNVRRLQQLVDEYAPMVPPPPVPQQSFAHAIDVARGPRLPPRRRRNRQPTPPAAGGPQAPETPPGSNS
eukprot:jgi/Picsp_1/1509/NSC_04987-R1_---NA---